MAGTRRKKQSKIVKEKKEVCTEMSGWKIGDIAWALTGTGEILHGEIKEFHSVDQVLKGQTVGKAATIMTLTDSKYRTVLISTLSENRIKKKRKP